MRYRPGFEDSPLAETDVIGLNGAGDGLYDSFLIFSLPADETVGDWDEFAQGEKELLIAAMAKQKMMRTHHGAEVAGRANCMNDLHAIPIWIARADREEEVTEKITGDDVDDLNLPQVAAPHELPFELEGPDIPLHDGGCGLGAVCFDDIPFREPEPPRPEPRTPSRPSPPDPCGDDNCGSPPSPPRLWP